MSTAIEWTDETWNPVVGCTKASGGCDHCYAKTEHDRRQKAALAGKVIHPQYLQPFETVQLMPERLDAPRHWKKPRRVFVNSVSDLFHEDIPFDFISRVFVVMQQTPRHTYQILTKRPARMLEFIREHAPVPAMTGMTWGVDYRPQNIWLGVSVENQACANYRIPLLIQTPASVRFLSCEPLLGPLDLDGYLPSPYGCDGNARNAGCELCGDPGLHWVIVGGESGPGARPCDVSWITAIVADCNLSGVPCFVKQIGAHPVCRNDDGADRWPGGEIPFDERYEPTHQGEIARLYLRNSKGGDPAEWPEELRVRQFPGEVPA